MIYIHTIFSRNLIGKGPSCPSTEVPLKRGVRFIKGSALRRVCSLIGVRPDKSPARRNPAEALDIIYGASTWRGRNFWAKLERVIISGGSLDWNRKEISNIKYINQQLNINK